MEEFYKIFIFLLLPKFTDCEIFRANEHKMAEMLLKLIIDRMYWFSLPFYATQRTRLRAIWTTLEQHNFLLQRFFLQCRLG
jgi:hypothetical protein